jgi:DNA-binding CsgD family transcriptional regulator
VSRALSVFDGPARSIRCAERIIAGGRGLGLEIRAGVHTGECEFLGDDIAGVAVHIAARVSAEAKAEEVLVSRTVRDLVTGSGIALEPSGVHQLKGVPGTWELFTVGDEVGPLPAPDQDRGLRPTDRAALAAARHAPGLLRAASRIRPLSTAVPASTGPGDLTPREVEVLRLLAQGLTDAQIADRLVVSRRTVHAHLRAVYRKLDVGSRSAATRWALEHGIG